MKRISLWVALVTGLALLPGCCCSWEMYDPCGFAGGCWPDYGACVTDCSPCPPRCSAPCGCGPGFSGGMEFPGYAGGDPTMMGTPTVMHDPNAMYGPTIVQEGTVMQGAVPEPLPPAQSFSLPTPRPQISQEPLPAPGAANPIKQMHYTETEWKCRCP